MRPTSVLRARPSGGSPRVRARGRAGPRRRRPAIAKLGIEAAQVTSAENIPAGPMILPVPTSAAVKYGLPAGVLETRPICAYPTSFRYRGAGPTRDATSLSCVRTAERR